MASSTCSGEIRLRQTFLVIMHGPRMGWLLVVTDHERQDSGRFFKISM